MAERDRPGQETLGEHLRLTGRVPSEEDQTKRLTFIPGGEPKRQLTPSDFRDEPTVTMNFPKPVNLTLSHSQTIKFERGAQEVPVSLKDHWYLRAHGVTLYNSSDRVEVAKKKAEDARVAAEKAKVEADRLAGEVVAEEAAAAAKRPHVRVHEQPVHPATRAQLEAKEKQDAADKAAEAKRIADEKAEHDKAAAEEQKVADAAESARSGKPVDQVRKEREAREAKAKATK